MKHFDLETLKFSVGESTYQKGIDLYEAGKVQNFQVYDESTCVASMTGGSEYMIVLSPKKFSHSDCNCYIGQNNQYCKHLVAVALHFLKKGEPLTPQEKEYISSLRCSEQRGELSPEALKEVKAIITRHLRYIKPYVGPSRTWDAYQDSLSQGVDRLVSLLSKLPVSLQTSQLVVNTLLRVERKLMNGVDDSDGVVRDFISDGVEVLKQYIEIDPECLKSIEKLQNLGTTSFGWEEELVELLESQ